MNRLEEIYLTLKEYIERDNKKGITAREASQQLNLERSNTSRHLNALVKMGLMTKDNMRPVTFYLTDRHLSAPKENGSNRMIETIHQETCLIDQLIGAKDSLMTAIQQSKAAIMYPPRGLHTLIVGETGVGKSMFAEIMYTYAKEIQMLPKDAPFVRFNCADYAENPQLLNAQIFGVKKGAYSGADKDREGIIKQANGGILFLDEVHRLSKQGQEMLFTFIDKGEFRRLGEADKVHTANLQLICATTEDTNSFMLKTFLRRIPMFISLPPLRKRSINERYLLIIKFINEESKRIQKSIYIEKNALIAFVLYECNNNIGQLKSDIQLSCAKAFLNFKSHKKEFIVIDLKDLPQEVKRGLLNLNKNRKHLEGLLHHSEEVIRFSYENDDYKINLFSKFDGEDFYDIIDKKVEDLKKEGISDNNIKKTITLDIERHFSQYINQVPTKIKNDDIKKVVDEEIVNFTYSVIKYASKMLNRRYDDNIIYGFMLHLNASIERIRLDKPIYHPKLNHIRIQYADEFIVAMDIARMLDESFDIVTPLDEIGYITMFIRSEEEDEILEETDRVGVIVVMHGNSTATSMVDVVNELLGIHYAIGIDMPLSLSPKDAYDLVRHVIIEQTFNSGLVLMVDMGSLHSFGGMIEEEFGIQVKTIKDTTTSSVMEITRKASLGRDLNEICNGYIKPKTLYSKLDKENRNVIVTACFTGEGAGNKLKEIIHQQYGAKPWIEIITLNYLDKGAFKKEIKRLNNQVNLMAIVGTVTIEIENLPYLSAVDILAGEGLAALDEIVEIEEIYYKAATSLTEHIQSTDVFKLMKDVRKTLALIETDLKLNISKDVVMGIILHACFLIDRLIKGFHLERKDDLFLLNTYSKEMIIIKDAFRTIERNHQIEINDVELINLCRMIVENR